MLISGMNSIGSTRNNSSDESVQSIDQKIRELKNEIKKIKENKMLSGKEKKKRIKNIEMQIKKLEEQKRRPRKKKNKDMDPTKENFINEDISETSINKLDTLA